MLNALKYQTYKNNLFEFNKLRGILENKGILVLIIAKYF